MNKSQLLSFRWNEFFDEQFTASEFKDSFPARVILQQGNIYTILSERGECNVKLTGKFHYAAKQAADYPVVGDFVISGRAKDSY